jgi:hypothetical protein
VHRPMGEEPDGGERGRAARLDRAELGRPAAQVVARSVARGAVADPAGDRLQRLRGGIAEHLGQRPGRARRLEVAEAVPAHEHGGIHLGDVQRGRKDDATDLVGVFEGAQARDVAQQAASRQLGRRAAEHRYPLAQRLRGLSRAVQILVVQGPRAGDVQHAGQVAAAAHGDAHLGADGRRARRRGSVRLGDCGALGRGIGREDLVTGAIGAPERAGRRRNPVLGAPGTGMRFAAQAASPRQIDGRDEGPVRSLAHQDLDRGAAGVPDVPGLPEREPPQRSTIHLGLSSADALQNLRVFRRLPCNMRRQARRCSRRLNSASICRASGIRIACTSAA